MSGMTVNLHMDLRLKYTVLVNGVDLYQSLGPENVRSCVKLLSFFYSLGVFWVHDGPANLDPAMWAISFVLL
jgi:hypothetical protein